MKNSNKKHTIQYRQGDVLIEQVTDLPENMKERQKENGRVILAHGEVTGHAHEIKNPKLATQYEINEALRALGDLSDAGTMENTGLVIEKKTTVVHDEHSAIPLAPGKYLVRRQREYSPEAIRNVMD